MAILAANINLFVGCAREFVGTSLKIFFIGIRATPHNPPQTCQIAIS